MKFSRNIVSRLQNDLIGALETDPLTGSGQGLEEEEQEEEEEEKVDIQTIEVEATAGEQDIEVIRKKRGGRAKNVSNRFGTISKLVYKFFKIT